MYWVPIRNEPSFRHHPDSSVLLSWPIDWPEPELQVVPSRLIVVVVIQVIVVVVVVVAVDCSMQIIVAVAVESFVVVACNIDPVNACPVVVVIEQLIMLI